MKKISGSLAPAPVLDISSSRFVERIDRDLLTARVLEDGVEQEFAFGLFRKSFFGHEALMMMYMAEAGSNLDSVTDRYRRIEARLVLIELFVNSKNEKVLSIRRMKTLRPDYKCRDVIVAAVNLRDLIELARQHIAGSGEYHVLRNNCQDFSQYLYRCLSDKAKTTPSALSLTHSDIDFLLQRYPPAYGQRTIDYLTLSTALERATRLPVPDLSPLSGSRDLSNSLTTIAVEEPNPGDILGIPLPESFVPLFVIYLGKKDQLLETITTLQDNQFWDDDSYMPTESEFESLKSAIRSCSATRFHLDRNGSFVALRDFDREFWDLAERHYIIRSLPDSRDHSASISIPIFRPERRTILVQRMIRNIGREVLPTSTATCLLATVFCLNVGLNANFPLGVWPEFAENKRTRERPSTARSVFDQLIYYPE